MRSTFVIGALSLASFAAAQPSGHRLHEKFHDKRQAVVTDVDYVTASTPDVIVYVNAEGQVLYTSFVSQTPATSSAAAAVPASTAAASASVAYSAPAYSAPAYSAPASSASAGSIAATASAASSAPAASSSSTSSSSSSDGVNGIGYSPYSGSYSANNVGCKTAAQVSTDFENIGSEYNLVRIYGTDCNQVENVLSVASAKGMKVFAGVYDITQVESEIATIISAANGDWSNFHTIAIGNELVNSGSATVGAVTAAITTARGLLKTAGYTGKIVTVDTFVAVMENPALCKASDYAAVNAHPYFDGSVAAAGSGSWLLNQMDAVSSACGGMDTMITETGWPWSGQTLGDAVPSVANQQVAVDTIKGNVTSNMILFTAFNDLWKAPGYMSVEQSWGLYGNSAAS